MNLTTKIPITKCLNTIDYSSKVFSVGSCFSENISEKLRYFKFNTAVNPFGILFQPIAIEKMFYRMIEKRFFTEKDIFYHNEQWHSFEVHSSLSHPDKDVFLSQLNEIINKTHSKISSYTHAIITLGTAWVYREKQSGGLVANCHKVPQAKFSKELLAVETISKSIEKTVTLLKQVNPKIHLIFTISPARHLKDGFVENQRSKAHLIAALHQYLAQENALQKTSYFPSYEILLDELRDYRFYAEDMLHPNKTAIIYVWNRFTETHIAEDAQQLMQEIDSIQTALQHKPFYAESKAHKQFLLKLEDKISTLQKLFPNIDF